MSDNIQQDNINAEVDSYTNYCKLLDYEVAKAKEYTAKAAKSAKNAIDQQVASFPYGVGPAIAAAKAIAKRTQRMVKDSQEAIETQLKCAQKLDELHTDDTNCS